MEKLKWETVQRKVSELIPYDFNPRSITAEKKAELKQSLEEFDLVEIPVIDFDDIIIAGHQRIEALFVLGRKDELIDVRFPNRKLTEYEFKKYMLVSNKHAGFYDFSEVAEHFADFDLEEFNTKNDEFIFEKPKILEPEEDDFDEKLPEEPETALGDLYEIGEHKLLCGSSTETDTWGKLFGEELADLVVTDPPYNVNYEGGTKDKLKIQNDSMSNSDFYQFLFDFYTALGSFLKPGGAIYVWHADSEGANFRQAFKDAGLLLKQCLIWVKNSFVMGRQDYQWKHEPCLEGIKPEEFEEIKTHEPCLYGWKEGASHNWYSDRKQSTVLNFDKPLRNAEHPTMKPVLLIAYQIGNSSKESDIVADGFLGSGTTMLASHQLNRKCYGLELDPKYCDVIVKRMLKYDATLIIKRNGEDVTDFWKNKILETT